MLADRLWLLSKTEGLRRGVTEDLIFDNSMDTLFDREKIKFDRAQGNYYPPIRGDRHIIVEAEDETLKHWAINALNRNHYTCLSPPHPSTLYPILKLKTAREMSFLPSGGEKIPVHSFEELTDLLKSLP